MIKDQLTVSLLNVVKIFSKEVSFVEKEIVRIQQNLDEPALQKFSEILTMIHQYKLRLEEPLRDLSFMDVNPFDCELGIETLKHRSHVKDKLCNLETSAVSLCQSELENRIGVCLARSLLKKSNENQV